MRNGKRQASFYADKELLERFQKQYPNILTAFLVKCIKAALKDRELFTNIFFGDF